MASSTTLADFRRHGIPKSHVTHGWSAFWRGRPWLAERRIGETTGVWDATPVETELLIQADRLVGGADAVLVIDDT